jgi:hypothetical protein
MMPATTVKLPHVSIGGYGAVCADASLEDLSERFMRHGADIERLTLELAAATQGRDIAWAEIIKRNTSKES